MRTVDADIASTLELFNYSPAGPSADMSIDINTSDVTADTATASRWLRSQLQHLGLLPAHAGTSQEALSRQAKSPRAAPSSNTRGSNTGRTSSPVQAPLVVCFVSHGQEHLVHGWLASLHKQQVGTRRVLLVLDTGASTVHLPLGNGPPFIDNEPTSLVARWRGTGLHKRSGSSSGSAGPMVLQWPGLPAASVVNLGADAATPGASFGGAAGAARFQSNGSCSEVAVHSRCGG